jgi:hypothetical protein
MQTLIIGLIVLVIAIAGIVCLHYSTKWDGEIR